MTGVPANARRLGKDFFSRPAPVVARNLVGALLVRADDGIVVRIVETEAYLQEDPACHAHRGMTARNAPLFGPPGHAYVYFSYGMHWCLNVVSGREGWGEGCLLRAAEPIAGLDVIRERRGAQHSERDLLRGPGRLGQALGLHREHSGIDVVGGELLSLSDDGTRPGIAVGPRVGVALAADVPWRFWVDGSPWVSAYKRSPRAPASSIPHG